MKIDDFLEVLKGHRTSQVPESGCLELARDCFRRGHFWLIPKREDTSELYLGRFWLSAPEPNPDPDSPAPWRSQNSVLLHYLHSADDDDALHDHPWSFETVVVEGGYREEHPSREWYEQRIQAVIDGVDPAAVPGPELGTSSVLTRGATRWRQAQSLHRIAAVDEGTWTIVRTGARCRKWGFHPPGRARVPWDTYLGVEYERAVEEGGG